MDIQQLLRWVDQPETHQKIVGDYEGSYALGVTSDPPAFLLRVEPNDIGQFPRSILLNGVHVPVIVHGGFVQPKPLVAPATEPQGLPEVGPGPAP